MAIKSINKSFHYEGADSYPVGFYSAYKIVMPEEGWVVKVGGVCVSNSGGAFKFFITTQETPGIGDPKASLLWSGATTFTALANSTAAVFEENVDNIHVISGQELFICMYAESGDARFGYNTSSGNVILDGPYGGGPVPPTVPLSGYTQYDDYRYAQWIEYDDTDPGGGPLPLNKFKYWDGTQWVNKPLKYWNGSAWIEKLVRRWNGSTWIDGVA